MLLSDPEEQFFGTIDQIINFINTTFPTELKDTSYVKSLVKGLINSKTYKHDIINKQVVTMVYAGNWKGIYLNDKLFCEGETIHENLWIKLLLKEYELIVNRLTLTPEQVSNIGSTLPNSLTEIIEIVE